MKSFRLKHFIALLLLVISPAVLHAEDIKVSVSMANSYLRANAKQKTYVKVGLTGFIISNQKQRTPVNVSIVLDRSGSMHGQKLEQAKLAAMMAIDRLHRNDIVSVVTYDDTVSVIVPATKVRNREMIHAAIRRIHSGGSTALFAGVSKGAEEIRKFLDKDRVNRIILLSDGLANVGPSTPGALADLGAALSKEGISVSTIGLGLGYNEDLMVQLAKRSDGNHAFVEHPRDLTRIFNLEFGDILSVVAQDVEVIIDCGNGVRPIRVLGRDADIYGKKVTVKMNQLYSNQEKYVLLELEAPGLSNKRKKEIANVSVSYKNMVTKRKDRLSRNIDVEYTDSSSKLKRNVNKDVMVAAVLLIGAEENKRAVVLRDKGNIKEAEKVLRSNAMFLKEKAKVYRSEELKNYSNKNVEDSENLEGPAWSSQRKKMRKSQSKIDMQQSY